MPVKRFVRALALCALALCIAVPALCEDDPIIVKVGDFSYPKSVVQGYLNSVARQYADEGYAVDGDTADKLKSMVIEGYADLAVSETKLRELGLDKLNAEQQKLLDEHVDGYFAEITTAYVDEIISTYNVEREQAEESAATIMALSGITRDAIYEQQASLYRNELMLEHVTKDMTFADEQVAARYDELFVAPERDKYNGDFAAFEKDVINNGNTCYYMPAGVRAIDRLVFAVPEGSEGVLTMPEGAELNAELQRLTELYSAELTDIANAARETADFSVITDKYPAVTLDSGYLVHADSTIWDAELKRVALELNNVGDISPLIRQGGELCIVCYRSELPEGAVQFTADNQQELNEYVLNDLRVSAFDAQIEKWKLDYDLELHPELLDTPTVE